MVVMTKRMKIVSVVSIHLQGATSKSAAKEAIPYRGNQYINKKNKRLPRSIKERVPNLAYLHNYNKISHRTVIPYIDNHVVIHKIYPNNTHKYLIKL